MATITPRRPIDREGLQRRVRHPLQSLRGYIRTYVTLEGVAVGLLYLGLWVWLGIAFDFGLFKALGFDWVKEVDTSLSVQAGFVLRLAFLVLLLLGLVAVVALKVFRRLFREFSDRAVALVLERRFPRELGDRLITAVELADPKIAKKYGFSQQMVDQTVQNAADRVEKVPVREVFNWKRLYFQCGLALLVILGGFVVAGSSYGVWAATQEREQSAWSFFGRLTNTGKTWAERNLLLMDRAYWVPRAYIQVVRFQDSKDHPGEMRVAAEEARPDVQVRAFEWVLVDRSAPDGLRPARLTDLEGAVTPALLAVPLPRDWGGWVIDLDDLDVSVPAGAVPADWNGKTAGFVRGELARPAVRKALAAEGALQGVEEMLDWTTWSVDRVKLQLERPEVREPMRNKHPAALRNFEDILGELEEVGDSPSWERTLVRMTIPEQVHVEYRGKKTKSSSSHERRGDNKYAIGLADLTESVRFHVWGEDYYTQSLLITLVPPPSLNELTTDKEEPAYIYWRLQGDQAPLKGKKQVFKNIPVPITGAYSPITVPLGTNLVLTAVADREIKDGVRMAEPATRQKQGSITPPSDVKLEADGKTFRTRFRNVLRPIEFEFQFTDMDNVRGRRHVLIEPVDDKGPEEVGNVEVTAVLRKPRFGTEGGKGGPAIDGLLITPDALVPYKGAFRDDYGLTKMAWAYNVEEVEFELVGLPTGKDKKPKGGLDVIMGGNTRLRRLGTVVSGLHGAPQGMGEGLAGAAYWAWVDRVVRFDLANAGKQGRTFEGSVPLEVFGVRLEERARERPFQEDVPVPALASRLVGPAPLQRLFGEHSVQQEEGFDFRKFLPQLKAADPKKAQMHYRVRMHVAATDNNVETGPTTVQSGKVLTTFLVVSENELLAQILIEEETLRDRLEKALDKLKNGKTFLAEQVSKLAAEKPAIDLVSIRVDEVRKLVQDSGSATRDVAGDYVRILREMEINRVDPMKVSKVDTKIVRPLEDAINPAAAPSFPVTDAAVTKLLEGLKDDEELFKKGDDPAAQQQLALRKEGHYKQANLALVQTDRLIAHLDMILQAMQGELVEREIIALLVQIERDQRRQAEILRDWRERLEKELLDSLRKGLQ